MNIERELASRADRRVLRWVGHVERMDEFCMARRVLMTKVRQRSDGWCEKHKIRYSLYHIIGGKEN